MTTALQASGSRSRASLPLPQGAVDAAFVVVLGLLGIVGFAAVYGGSGYLVVGTVGLLLGVAVTELARRWRQPVLAEALITVVLFLLLGGALADRGGALAGVVPTPGTLSTLGHVGIAGWKELLTAAPPVGNSGDLLAIPYIVGLVGGVSGQSVARRTRVAAAPLVGPVGILVLGILFGARHPQSVVLQGAVFGALAIGWTVVRHHRQRRTQGGIGGGGARLLVCVALLAVAGLAATVVGGHLPGAASRQRLVLSRYVVPPFEANQQPSPLAGFRQYVKGQPANTALLFRVGGVAPGSLVRISTMDAYDGIVWGFAAGGPAHGTPSSDAFRRFGAVLPAGQTGREETVTVHIGSLGGVWVPALGAPRHIAFFGPRAAALTAQFRYDTATGTAAEPGGLQPGDAYTLTTAIPPTPTAAQLASASASSATVPVSGVPAVVTSDANQWAGSAPSAWGKVSAIARHLRAAGYYSNGSAPTAGPGAPVLSAPGHGAARLETFLEGGGLVGTHIVGDDEQFAATLALMANAVGVPARVVLGAEVERGGIVRGRDVHAWVQVALNGFGWVTVGWQSFLPTRPAYEVPPVSRPNASSSSPVEPPIESALHIPVTAQAGGSAAASASRFAHHHPTPRAPLPTWVKAVVGAVLAIVLLVGVVVGTIVGLKRRRRRRRRRSTTTSGQIAGAWAELLDVARDLGTVIPGGRTRREQAGYLSAAEALELARVADAAVFGPGDPTAAASAAYWAAMERFTRHLRARLSLPTRVRAALSLRSLQLAGARGGTA